MRRAISTVLMRMPARLAAPWAIVALFVLGLVPAAMAQAPGTRERQIRTALVYKLARFVTWPESILPASSPFIFCYVSDDPTSQVLSGIEGRAIQARRTRMRRLEIADARSLGGCHLLYLAGGATLAGDARAAALGAATLIVADGTRDEADAAMVQLVPRDNRLSLLVDLVSVRAAQLRIDATLLQMVEVRQ